MTYEDETTLEGVDLLKAMITEVVRGGHLYVKNKSGKGRHAANKRKKSKKELAKQEFAINVSKGEIPGVKPKK